LTLVEARSSATPAPFAPSELLFSHINIYEKRGLSPIVYQCQFPIVLSVL